MDMRKLLLSLLVVAGLINSLCCTAEEKLLLPEEVANIGRIADVVISIRTNKEFIDLEERQVAVGKIANNLIEAYVDCNALGNCDKLPNLKSLYEQICQEGRQIEDKRLKIIEETGASQAAIDSVLLMQMSKK